MPRNGNETYDARLGRMTMEDLLMEHEAMSYALEALPATVEKVMVKAGGRPRPSVGADVQDATRDIVKRKLREFRAVR